ncbi:MAG: hypothetical protein ACK55I_16385, partial [bacterium]
SYQTSHSRMGNKIENNPVYVPGYYHFDRPRYHRTLSGSKLLPEQRESGSSFWQTFDLISKRQKCSMGRKRYHLLQMRGAWS